MISIYFRPDRTEICQGSLHKDLTFHIADCAVTDPALSFIENEGAGETAGLERFMAELKGEFSISSDDVYIVLPDYLFAYIESVDYINEENLRVQIEEHTGEDAENLYIAMPVSTTSPAPDRQSVYAIRKFYIDKIVEVCMKERIGLASIEPASMGFFRAFGNWHDEMPLVEIFPEKASIINYSPAGGIFMTDCPNISEMNLRQAESAETEVSTAYAANDYTAGETYMNVNTDMPYYVLTENKEILKLTAVQNRSPEEKLVFPEFIIADSISEDEHAMWMPAVGTLLQVFDDLPEKYEFDNPLYDRKDSFITVKSGNLLPENAKKASQSRQWRRVIERWCKVACAIFGALSIIECGAGLYFSTYEINPSLQADYETAKADLASIERETEIIALARKSEQRPVEAYKALTLARPDGVGFTKLTIGDANAKPNGQENNSNPYVKLTAVSGNAMLFQDFRSNLDNQVVFMGASINTIAGHGGYQQAEMSMQRRRN